RLPSLSCLCYYMILRPPRPPSTLFPYTPLFRSCDDAQATFDVEVGAGGGIRGVSEEATCGAQQLQPLLLSGPQMNPESSSSRLRDRKSTRLNSSHVSISYAVFCLKKQIHARTQQ